jgi:hypothetical protein
MHPGLGRRNGHAVFEIDGWATLADEVAGLSRAAVTGPFEIRTERCVACPFSASCAGFRSV